MIGKARLGPSALNGFAVLAPAATAVMALVAQRVVFSRFAFWDDEGHFLIYVRQWLERGELYDVLHSEYGPGYLVLFAPLFRVLGLDVDHETGRALAIALWLATSVLIGVALLLLTGSVAVALSSQLVAFLALYWVYEPMHPGLLTTVLLAALIVAVAALPRRAAAPLFAIGAIAGAVALIKVNVGGLAIAAIAFAVATAAPQTRRIARLRWGVVGLAAALPFAVMAGRLGEGWAFRYAFVVSAGMVALSFAVLPLRPRPEFRLKDLGWLAGGASAVLLLLCAVVIARGTSLGGLLQGVVIRPADFFRFSPSFSHPLRLWPASPVLAVAGLAGAVATWWLRRGGGEELRERVARFGAAARLAAGLAIWVAAISIGLYGGHDGPGYSIGAALAWVAAIPRRAEEGEWTGFVRVLVPALAVLQLLHAFPVAGSQVAWGALPLVAVGGICVADGFAELLPLVPWPAGTRRLVRGVSLVALGVGAVIWAAPVHRSRVAQYPTELGLPGAERVRMPTGHALVLREVAATLRSRCETFVSLPGLNSFYVWSGLEPPATFTPGDWMYFLSADQQQRIVDRIRGLDGLCLLRNTNLVAFWVRGQPIPRRPLYVWFENNFRTTERIGGYELMTP